MHYLAITHKSQEQAFLTKFMLNTLERIFFSNIFKKIYVFETWFKYSYYPELKIVKKKEEKEN